MLLPKDVGQIFWVDFNAKTKGSGTQEDPFSLPKYAFEKVRANRNDVIISLPEKDDG